MLFYVLIVLFRSVYCLCVNVYCATATGWLPNCSYQIYKISYHSRPTAVYGCEIWVLKESIIQKLSVIERKILREISGPTKEANGIWRIKTNKELGESIKHRNIINYVKAQRLCRFGHTNRVPETGTVKRVHKWKPFTGRPAGKPKSRWEDDVRNDMKKAKLINWAEHVQDHLKWKDIFEKAKTVSEL